MFYQSIVFRIRSSELRISFQLQQKAVLYFLLNLKSSTSYFKDPQFNALMNCNLINDEMFRLAEAVMSLNGFCAVIKGVLAYC